MTVGVGGGDSGGGPNVSLDGMDSLNVGDWPAYALIYDNALYIAHRDGLLTGVVLDGSGRAQGTPNARRVGGNPTGMAWDDQGRLWLADFGDFFNGRPGGNVVRILNADLSTRDIFVGENAFPRAVAFDAAQQLMWVSLYGSSYRRVVAFDMDGNLRRDFTLAQQPGALLLVNGVLWVAGRRNGNQPGDRVYGIDTATGGLIFEAQVGKGPYNLAWDGAQTIYVANYEDTTVSAVDITSGSGRVFANVGRAPTAAIWDGARLWVALYGASDGVNDGAITALNANGQKLWQSPLALNIKPVHVIFDPLNNALWAINQGRPDLPGRTVVRIELATVLPN
jgi:DNA-binding beta-propeller fold protein YncE